MATLPSMPDWWYGPYVGGALVILGIAWRVIKWVVRTSREIDRGNDSGP